MHVLRVVRYKFRSRSGSIAMGRGELKGCHSCDAMRIGSISVTIYFLKPLY